MPSTVRRLTDLVRRPDAETCDRIAIEHPGGTVTYGELWARVHGLRAALRSSGIRAGDRVALCLRRSPEYVVALLATLAEGALAIPVDAGLPPARIASLVETARPKLVLHDDDGGRGIDVRTVRPAENAEQPAPGAGLLSMEPAVVLFTAGSPGRPKGVVLHHAGVANRLLWAHDHHGHDETDRVLHQASVGLGAALPEILTPLIAGGTLVIAPPDVSVDTVVRLIRERSVTTVHVVPSALRRLVSEPELARCVSLRRVFCGGEILGMDLVRRFRRTLNARLYYQYGPVEASISVTWWDCAEGHDGIAAPLGRPIDNVRCHVLGEDLEPVRPGATGELWISGVAVAHGYLDDELQTLRRFRPDPFALGGRMYRTGDLVTLGPTGCLRFQGRVEHQMRVRGVPVEPDRPGGRHLPHHRAPREAPPGPRARISAPRTPGCGRCSWPGTAPRRPAPPDPAPRPRRPAPPSPHRR
jgi:amino acid adenylation domain-containing protein